VVKEEGKEGGTEEGTERAGDAGFSNVGELMLIKCNMLVVEGALARPWPKSPLLLLLTSFVSSVLSSGVASLWRLPSPSPTPSEHFRLCPPVVVAPTGVHGAMGLGAERGACGGEGPSLQARKAGLGSWKLRPSSAPPSVLRPLPSVESSPSTASGTEPRVVELSINSTLRASNTRIC